MTGSVAIDIVLGLVFIYLLYSLLATVLGEIVAVHMGLRARVLKQALQRMLEDAPQTSEKKIIAFVKNARNSIRNIFSIPEGPATCVFYNIPLIKYLGKNTFESKPSYISKENFSKTMLEIFRKYGGQEELEDIEKIKAVLRGCFAYESHLFKLKEIIRKNTFDENNFPLVIINYKKIRILLKAAIDQIETKDVADLAQKKLLKKIKEKMIPDFQISFGRNENAKILKSEIFLELSKDPEIDALIHTMDRNNINNAKVLFVKRFKTFIKAPEKKDKSKVYKVDQLLNLFGRETKSHLLSLLKDAKDDIPKFRMLLEQWFDDTMERATGWYKQKIQLILFLIGLGLSIVFNASTLDIVNTLSKDKESREQLVHMASAYMANHTKPAVMFSDPSDAILDSLLHVKETIENDIKNTSGILGLGWNYPDSLELLSPIEISQKRKGIIKPEHVLTLITNAEKKESKCVLVPVGMDKKTLTGLLKFSNDCMYLYPFSKSDLTSELRGVKKNKVKLYKTKFCMMNIWGYVLSAIAISLGAPFWFDLLNKLMQLRGALKNDTISNKAKDGRYIALSDPKPEN